jgi:DNA-binding phage protein
MVSDDDCPAPEGRVSVLLEQLAEKVAGLDPDRHEAFTEWMGSGAVDVDVNAPSEQLREVIRQRGLTAYRVAKDAGASVDAVQRFMNGQTGLNTHTFDKVCVSLGLVLVEQSKAPRRRRGGKGTTQEGGETDGPGA